MKRIHKEIILISAPEIIWNVLTEKTNYEKWTSIFAPSSTFIGEMKLNEQLIFTNGQGSGLVAKVTEFAPYKKIVFSFIGELENNEVVTKDYYNGVVEEYTIIQQQDKCLLQVDIDILDLYFEDMNKMWDQAIIKIKELVEGEN
ncbi:SRPBCC family protein [Mycoplasma sp. P36-A1]|uniref:SRPBCC family protein n=1 Tax=Mycoplasma sp. P36-A1 TaxID=3252900 RepID=UPI003C2CCEAC